MLTDSASQSANETSRVEAFSDGVFAIAITLLILEIQVPRDMPDGNSLLAALLQLWPHYLAFLVSFATIGIMWINHHRIFALVRRRDHMLLIFNSLLLLAVTFVPFPTSLLATYLQGESGTARVAAVFYSATFVLLAIFFNLLWWHIAYWEHLIDESVPARVVQNITRSYKLGILFYALSLVAAFFSAPIGFGVTLLLAIFFALPTKSKIPTQQ